MFRQFGCIAGIWFATTDAIWDSVYSNASEQCHREMMPQQGTTISQIASVIHGVNWADEDPES